MKSINKLKKEYEDLSDDDKSLFRNYVNKINIIYAVVYNEDSFEGISVPIELRYILDQISSVRENYFVDIYENYDSYKDCEVDFCSYVKDASLGTKHLKTELDFKKWFENRFNRLPKDIKVILEKLELVLV